MDANKELVFVYGTLRRGASNAFRMEGAEFLRPGGVRGRLYRIDWYPGIVLSEDCGLIAGELWEVSSEMLEELDGFEGSGYRRVEVYVDRYDCDHEWIEWNTEPKTAWVWEWKGAEDSKRLIPSGDWFDIESPRPPKICTGLGCLCFFALPLGSLVILGLARSLVVFNENYISLALSIVLVLTPLLALLCVRLGYRRREKGANWRELTKMVSIIWLALASIGFVGQILKFFMGR